jgi:hypothetical protein
MSGIQNKNLIFYSRYPGDKLSAMCLEALDKSPALNKQFIRICIHDPRDCNKPSEFRLPDRVLQCKTKGLIPIIAIAGYKQPVFANSALSWITESSLTKDGGIMPSNIHGQGTADNCCTIEQASLNGNALFDTGYNIGFSDGQGEFNKDYASIDEAAGSRIVTYEELNDKKSASAEISQRIEKMKFDRESDVPRSQARIGGLDGGAPPGMPGYGAPPGMPSYGAPPGMPSYGAPSGMPGYGAPPGMPSYGAPPGMPGYGAPPGMPGYGAPPGMPGYGAPPGMPGYGAPPGMPGYGAPPGMPGYGAPPGMPAPAPTQHGGSGRHKRR